MTKSTQKKGSNEMRRRRRKKRPAVNLGYNKCKRWIMYWKRTNMRISNYTYECGETSNRPNFIRNFLLCFNFFNQNKTRWNCIMLVVRNVWPCQHICKCATNGIASAEHCFGPYEKLTSTNSLTRKSFLCTHRSFESSATGKIERNLWIQRIYGVQVCIHLFLFRFFFHIVERCLP